MKVLEITNMMTSKMSLLRRARPYAADDLNCPHFVVAFQDGDWDDDLCPPVFCNGFRHKRSEPSAAIQRTSGVVRRVKPGTARHPRIEAYFCVSADEAAGFPGRRKPRSAPPVGS